MKKKSVVKLLDKFPDEFNLDELFASLIVIEKIDEGLKELQKGEIIPHDKVKRILLNWKRY